MTLRRTIAAALRKGADQASARAIATFLAATVREREEGGTARLIAAAVFFKRVHTIADWLDPHAHPAAAERNDDARSNAPAPSAAVPVAEEAAVAAVADAKGGHGEQGSTAPAFSAQTRGRHLHLVVEPEDAMRWTKGGRA